VNAFVCQACGSCAAGYEHSPAAWARTERGACSSWPRWPSSRSGCRHPAGSELLQHKCHHAMHLRSEILSPKTPSAPAPFLRHDATVKRPSDQLIKLVGFKLGSSIRSTDATDDACGERFSLPARAAPRMHEPRSDESRDRTRGQPAWSHLRCIDHDTRFGFPASSSQRC
jgi:hypothetical protein